MFSRVRTLLNTHEGEDVLSVRGVHKSYADVRILVDLSFSVGRGQAVAVVGRNGSGKSTLLKCLVGAETYDEGTIELYGAPLDEASADVRSAMASLLDDVDFFPDISVAEHLRLVAWLHGTQSPDSEVERLIDELELADVRDQLPPTLSSGQRHRLGLGSCLVRPRELLVLDEPEHRMDTQGRQWLKQRLNDEKAAGVAIVFASHDSALIDAVADTTVQVGRQAGT